MSVPGDTFEKASLATGLAIAAIGLLNALPSFGVLPQIGPFPIDWFRPTFIGLSVLTAVLLVIPDLPVSKPAGWLHITLLIVCLPMIAYAGYGYFDVSRKMATSIFFFSVSEAITATIAAAVTVYLCWHLWGSTIAALGSIAFAYLATGQYWPSGLATAPHDMVETIAANIWYATDQGILGNIMGIVLSTVLPFIILGSVLDGCGAGRSMIRISFRLMRRLKGGPAYAAISASALFGTVSGGAVANVVGTGVVTIPMIKRRGFSPNFAGAVEAAASTGGQILPPIMGAAALVMADLIGVNYLTVITAAIIPAIAYYASLFLAVYFQAGKIKLKTCQDDAADLEVAPQDYINLILVVLPLALIVWLLINGYSPAGASISALLVLLPASYLNPEIRQRPLRLVRALAEGGRSIAKLAIAIAVVGIVVASFSATGVPTKFAVLLSSASEVSLFFALLVSAIGCVVLGMGMPTLPAYIAIVVVMGPTLTKFGMDLLTVHFLVFFVGVASVITPPVALASYAAAAIAGGRPIATSIISSKIGAMIFLIPFAFVFHPELLIVVSAGDESVFWLSLLFLAATLYLCSSSLIGYDRAALGGVERALRLAAAALLISPVASANWAGLFLGTALVGWHVLRLRSKVIENAKGA
ncbi:TRAP transporter fused permease subunit [Actibacterium sp. 188UL27-1]|uniref:TRAP transporter permease n=1 Tax=Actibacterium sp. 188UL27-1 TaxID=2786961 RepID=UPI00195C5514|nr:TRAP transporter fused permease subunit [Actibacterium sp. 188UL27-1]MBM7070421.1 TRAP transporter fused permease subunit [Actibacterium sp. 188UL27-1]